MSELVEAYRRVERLTHIDMEHKNIFELLTSTTEELGELSSAVLIENGTFGNTHKTLDEPAKSEAADLIICAICMSVACGNSLEDMVELMHKKLDKWKDNQEKHNG